MVYCKKCGCKDINYFGIKKGKYYCRRCISFNGEEACITDKKIKKTELKLNYELTKDQIDMSNQVLKMIEEKKNVLIYAVCGAGKTEIVFKAIERTLKQNKTYIIKLSNTESDDLSS